MIGRMVLYALLVLLLVAMVLVALAALDLGDPDRVVTRRPTPLPDERPAWSTDPRMPALRPRHRESDADAYRAHGLPPRIPSAPWH